MVDVDVDVERTWRRLRMMEALNGAILRWSALNEDEGAMDRWSALDRGLCTFVGIIAYCHIIVNISHFGNS